MGVMIWNDRAYDCIGPEIRHIYGMKKSPIPGPCKKIMYRKKVTNTQTRNNRNKHARKQKEITKLQAMSQVMSVQISSVCVCV